MDDIKELLIKRARGFYYDEETAEYEVKGTEKFLLCKKFCRLYFNAGYLKVKIIKIYVGNKIIRIDPLRKYYFYTGADSFKMTKKIKNKYRILVLKKFDTKD